MAFGPIEVMATIVIAMGIIKLIMILVAPKKMFKAGEKFFSKPTRASLLYFALAIVVLYYLLEAGMRIRDILAVALFMKLLIGMILAKYADSMLKAIPETVIKDNWLYTTFVVILLLWGIKDLFF